MKPAIGGLIWIACEVKPGPFSDERLVRVPSDFGEWVGFVPVEALHDAINEGSTFVRATITDVRDDRFTVHLPGHSVTPNAFEGSLARVTALGTIETGHSPIPQ